TLVLCLLTILLFYLLYYYYIYFFFFFFQAEDGIRDKLVTGVQTCALPILSDGRGRLGNAATYCATYGRTRVGARAGGAPGIGRARCPGRPRRPRCARRARCVRCGGHPGPTCSPGRARPHRLAVACGAACLQPR